MHNSATTAQHELQNREFLGKSDLWFKKRFCGAVSDGEGDLMEGWKKALLVAGAAGAGCVLYYLLREEQDTKQPSGDEIEEKAT
eukprot:Skav213397  [mRNA]  locus=scaffold797:553773:555125:- [translate_table: standard]